MKRESASFMLESREDFLLCELVAAAVSSMTIVRMSPFAPALRSATMPACGPAPAVGQSESARAPTEKSAVASASLEADLDTVFIDDDGGEIFLRLGVADGDGVALRAIF